MHRSGTPPCLQVLILISRPLRPYRRLLLASKVPPINSHSSAKANLHVQANDVTGCLAARHTSCVRQRPGPELLMRASILITRMSSPALHRGPISRFRPMRFPIPVTTSHRGYSRPLLGLNQHHARAAIPSRKSTPPLPAQPQEGHVRPGYAPDRLV